LFSKIQCQALNKDFCFFIFSHSKFDVGRSMFDVHFFKLTFFSPRRKNNLALMARTPFQINIPKL